MSKGMAIQRVQAMVCEVVLKESNADVLMNIRYNIHMYMYMRKLIHVHVLHVHVHVCVGY